MAGENKSASASEEQLRDIERVKKHLEMLDQRLDNIDSMVTAVAERVMKQPVTLNVTCPYCHRNIEITILGNEKPPK